MPTRSRKEFHRQAGLDPGVCLAFRPPLTHHLRIGQGGTDVCGEDRLEAGRQPDLAVLVPHDQCQVLRSEPEPVNPTTKPSTFGTGHRSPSWLPLGKPWPAVG
ncbi:hypothetical protein AB0P40_36675, partial [Streptomyces sp. NPDC079189]|uniref:hypothetical protein n=1 Tax=Streptomyces sp. NPDC079189 TaxID=3154514 RepID=UPI0034151CA7